jgi:TRAP-type C4-dicarboxylate transport system permease large subunit
VVSIIAIAGAFGWLLAYLDFNELILNALLSVTDKAVLTLIILIIIMLVLTMFVESLAILIIMIPAITYIGALYGFNPFYLGLAVIMATQIGATTPPVAVGLFVATSIAKTDYQQTVKYSLPFILALVSILILIIAFPELSTWIPEKFLNK